MPGTSPGMTSFALKPNFTSCILSQTLTSGVSRVSKDEANELENALKKIMAISA
jgi:hypothetical protein